MIQFEDQLKKLLPKLLNHDYAQRVYASLCNVDWLSLEAPSDWYDCLQQQDLEWKRKNAIFWRKWPRSFFSWLRSLVIPRAYRFVNENGKKVHKSFQPWSWLNIKLMSLEYKFWVYPSPSPDWIYGCSWRYAGGLVAEIRGKGEDYMNFYCSGNEGNVDEEFEEDMTTMGWKPIKDN